MIWGIMLLLAIIFQIILHINILMNIHNVSIVDKEAVLALAQKLQIDGIMSFAVDPGVITAAYVQERLGLPGNPYASVLILQNKDLFRDFLREQGFTIPNSRSFSSLEEALSVYLGMFFP